jgi:hypothetical protein
MEIEQLNEKVKKIFETKAEYAEKKRIASAVNAEFEKQESELIQILESLELPSFKTQYGTISYSTRTSFQTPKEIEDKIKFALWLYKTFSNASESEIKQFNITLECLPVEFWAYFGVNSATVNSIAKEYCKQREEAGDLEVHIDGLVRGEAQPILSMRKA